MRKGVGCAPCRRHQGDPTMGRIEKNVEHDVAKEVRARIQIVPVFARTVMVREMLEAAFGPGSLPCAGRASAVYPVRELELQVGKRNCTARFFAKSSSTSNRTHEANHL